jgi:cytoplasmic FMR1 interacting protein
MNNLQTGSVLDYTLTYLHAILSRAREKWNLPPKSGLVEITLSKEYHRLYSGLQYVSLCNLSLLLHLPINFVSAMFASPLNLVKDIL